jgi:hypothetical protein
MVHLSRLLQKLRHQRGPAGLVACAEAGTIVTVETHVEQDQSVRPGLSKSCRIRFRSA